MPGVPEARSDRLSLAGLRCRAHIGVTEEERRERQRLEIDLDLYTDLEAAGTSGDLGRTIDYRLVADGVRALIEGRPWHLVEAAAQSSAAFLLERFPTITRAVVRVRKYVLPDTAHIEVEMDRHR